MQTDKTGCGSRVIDVTEFGMTSRGSFEVNSTVEESGTGEGVKQMAVSIFTLQNRVMKHWSFVPPGITMIGTTSAMFTRDYVKVHYEDTPNTYRPGMVFKGKVTASLRSLALLIIIEQIL